MVCVYGVRQTETTIKSSIGPCPMMAKAKHKNGRSVDLVEIKRVCHFCFIPLCDVGNSQKIVYCGECGFTVKHEVYRSQGQPTSKHEPLVGKINPAPGYAPERVERPMPHPTASTGRLYDFARGQYIDPPATPQQEEEDLQKAIAQSNEDSRNHLVSKGKDFPQVA